MNGEREITMLDNSMEKKTWKRKRDRTLGHCGMSRDEDGACFDEVTATEQPEKSQDAACNEWLLDPPRLPSQPRKRSWKPMSCLESSSIMSAL